MSGLAFTGAQPQAPVQPVPVHPPIPMQPTTIGSLNAAEEGIAPFVCKLYELVNDPGTQNLIAWSEEHAKQAFVVWDPVEFSTTLLPKFFKHSNFCSYVIGGVLL